MDRNAMYEKWRADRSRIEPPEGFADRIMQRVESLPLPTQPWPLPSLELSRPQRLARLGVCAAAVVVVLFRVAELLRIFAATGIEN
jgi:hypothetical protein